MGVIFKNNFLNITQTLVKYPRIGRSLLYRQSLYGIYKNKWIHKGKARTLPCEIVVILSRRCFLNCATCGTSVLYGSDNTPADFIETRYMKKIADELSTWLTPVYVKLTGGEASLHPDFFEILRYFNDKNIPVRLSSNGLRFAATSLANSLVDSGTDVITISIDGIPEDHNVIRKSKNLFQSLSKAISKIKERRRHNGTNKPMIQIATVVSKTNYARLPELAEELEKLGIDWWQIGFIMYARDEMGLKSEKVCKELGGVGDDKWKCWRDNPVPNLDIDPVVLEKNFKEILSRSYSFPVSALDIGGYEAYNFYNYHFTDHWIHNNLCSNPYTSMVILPPGKGTFCIDFPQFFYGDIRNKSLREVWFSEKAQTFRKNFMKYYNEHNENMPQCLRCVWRFW
jgi:radical SAM protein with 4Fe4S-binding SPASM domain